MTQLSALVLRTLKPSDESAFLNGLSDWPGDDLSWYSFLWKEGMSFGEMLVLLDQETRGINLAPDRVPHSMLYGFVGNEIVGRVSVRHSLNDSLRRRGGHLGYAVAPKFRGRGYGFEMAKQSLSYCQHLGLKELLVTCGEDNAPSWKIIERLGGRLNRQLLDPESNEQIRHYSLIVPAQP